MSHVVSIKCELKSLEAIQKACERMGWIFKHGQRTYRWYGRWMDDSPLPEQLLTEGQIKWARALTPEARKEFMTGILGRCDHAIQIPGARYDIGLVLKDGKFVPVWDWWRQGGLCEVLPENGMNGFIQAYTIEAAKLQAQQDGLNFTEEVKHDGTICLRITT